MARGIQPPPEVVEEDTQSAQSDAVAGIEEPSAPPVPIPYSNTSNYVRFLVNRGSHVVIGPRVTIMAASIELARIIQDDEPIDGYYRLNEEFAVGDFEDIIKFFEIQDIIFRDMADALRKLEFAHRYQCARLLRHCICEVDNIMTVGNVISVLQTVRSFVLNSRLHKEPLDNLSMDHCLEGLLYNVMQFIDQNADEILQKDEIYDDSLLNFNELECILVRDTLITSEQVIYNCLGRWSRGQCLSRNLEITAENRRKVLGPLSYLPRYLQMEPKDFELACKRYEILDKDESNLIRDFFEKRLQTSLLTDEQKEMLLTFEKPRSKYARMPVHLSNRSHPKHYPSKMRKNERIMEGESKCSSFFYWFCGCWAVVCD